MYIKDKWQEK